MSHPDVDAALWTAEPGEWLQAIQRRAEVFSKAAALLSANVMHQDPPACKADMLAGREESSVPP